MPRYDPPDDTGAERSRAFHEVARGERERYLAFIAAVGRVVAPLFATDGLSAWWLTLTAEKSPFKSIGFARLAALLAYGEESGEPPRALRVWLGGWVRLAKLMLRCAYVRLRVGGRAGRLRALGDARFVTATYFPLLDREAAREGRFLNRYIGAYQRGLEAERPGQHAQICIQVGTDGFNFAQAVGLMRRFARSGEPALLAEEFSRLWDPFLLGWRYAAVSLRFMRHRGEIAAAFRYPEAVGRDVWPQHAADMHLSLAGRALADGLVHAALLERAVARMRTDSVLVAVAEMQPWERAVYAASRERGIRTVAMQHTHVPIMQLHHFDDPSEIAWEAGGIARPQPDCIATVGELPRGLFLDVGWPPERLAVWGAQRYESLRGARERRVPWHERGREVVVALSISREEAAALGAVLAAAFSEPPEYRVTLKAHPALDLAAALEEADIELDPAVFDVTDRPLDDFVPTCRAMVVTESSSSFTATAYCVPVIIARLDGIPDCNPMSYVSDLPSFTYSAEDLRRECDRLVAAERPPVVDADADAFLDAYLTFPADDASYVYTIESLREPLGAESDGSAQGDRDHR